MIEAEIGQSRGRGQGRLFSDTGRQPEPLCILSYGGGQDSTAILLKLIEDPAFRARWAPGRLACVMSQIREMNMHHTLRYVGRMRRFCEDKGLEFYFLTAGGPYHSQAWPDLISQYRREQYRGVQGVSQGMFGAVEGECFLPFPGSSPVPGLRGLPRPQTGPLRVHGANRQAYPRTARHSSRRGGPGSPKTTQPRPGCNAPSNAATRWWSSVGTG